MAESCEAQEAAQGRQLPIRLTITVSGYIAVREAKIGQIQSFAMACSSILGRLLLALQGWG